MPNIERVEPESLPATLRVLLARPGHRRADVEQVQQFTQYLGLPGVDWRAWRTGPPDQPSAIAFVVLLPGRTAVVLVPPTTGSGVDRDEQRDLVVHSLERSRGLSLHYAQALVDPVDVDQAALFSAAGFRHITTLNYLERKVRYPWSDPPDQAGLSWVQYDAATHARFGQAIRASYVDSADCPELSSLRPIDDVIAAHQASGVFTPALWELAVVDGADAGCLLLAPLSRGSIVELVYMGIAPAWRGRGLGELFMRRALERCRQERIRQLTTVVDNRNTRAKRLYARFDMRLIARRDAYLFRWSGPTKTA